MKTSELIRLLKRHGCYLLNHRANHDVWFSPTTGKTFLVWRHKSRDIPIGTLKSILNAAGIKEE
ncbi:MAG: type II toxin-antitoxin system HicA family toxin [Clostridia bacterium]|nr:type II toxin-antitoxin system HicA family toxin [Clostridia bacterium]